MSVVLTVSHCLVNLTLVGRLAVLSSPSCSAGLPDQAMPRYLHAGDCTAQVHGLCKPQRRSCHNHEYVYCTSLGWYSACFASILKECLSLPAGASQSVKPGERPQRDLAWTRAASHRVCALLRQALPPLCSHPRPAVRAALPTCASLSSKDFVVLEHARSWY